MTDTLDALMRGRFQIVQSAKGHRAGLDAMLLQAVVPNDARGHLIDLGAGCGTIAFAALTRSPGMAATLVERDKEECARIARALELEENAHLHGRVEIIRADVAEARLPAADFVLANPPYNDERHRPAEAEQTRRAHSGSVSEFEIWARVASKAVKPGGTVAFILRPEWWPHLRFAQDFGDRRLVAIRSRAGRPASRIIALATKGRRTGASLPADIVVHGEERGFTPRVARILDGEECLFDAGG